MCISVHVGTTIAQRVIEKNKSPFSKIECALLDVLWIPLFYWPHSIGTTSLFINNFNIKHLVLQNFHNPYQYYTLPFLQQQYTRTQGQCTLSLYKPFQAFCSNGHWGQSAGWLQCVGLPWDSSPRWYKVNPRLAWFV